MWGDHKYAPRWKSGPHAFVVPRNNCIKVQGTLDWRGKCARRCFHEGPKTSVIDPDECNRDAPLWAKPDAGGSHLFPRKKFRRGQEQVQRKLEMAEGSPSRGPALIPGQWRGARDAQEWDGKGRGSSKPASAEPSSTENSVRGRTPRRPLLTYRGQRPSRRLVAHDVSLRAAPASRSPGVPLGGGGGGGVAGRQAQCESKFARHRIGGQGLGGLTGWPSFARVSIGRDSASTHTLGFGPRFGAPGARGAGYAGDAHLDAEGGDLRDRAWSWRQYWQSRSGEPRDRVLRILGRKRTISPCRRLARRGIFAAQGRRGRCFGEVRLAVDQ